MNLAIDIGNSYAKIGCFSGGELDSPVRRISYEELEKEVQALNPSNIVMSSVARQVDSDNFPFILKFNTLILDHNTPLPITLNYDTPKTLGVDRIAAAVGAIVINPRKVSMIIDAGTCITYDLIDGNAVFHGGIISPGLKLRFHSMKELTQNLPLVDPDTIKGETVLLGKTTVDAMKSGVINGINGEMNSFIERYNELFPDLKVIMCGGEAKFFESSLKASIFAVPELVLIGLNRILEYNV